MIVARIDLDELRREWSAMLARQLPALPPVDEFIAELRDAIAWWLEPAKAAPMLPTIAVKPGEALVPRVFFPSFGLGRLATPNPMDAIRRAARNRLLALVRYKDHERLVEPYSIRTKGTGNVLLYVHERTKDGVVTDGTRAYFVDDIQAAQATTTPFTPRYYVEI